MELPDSISIETSLSICVFHFSARRSTDCFDSAVSPRFQPVRSMSPPQVSHSRDLPLCACRANDMPPRQKNSNRHVARIIVMGFLEKKVFFTTEEAPERCCLCGKGHKSREYVRGRKVSTLLRRFPVCFALSFMSRAMSLLVALVLIVALASAQEINIAIGLGTRATPVTIFDQIDDARERRAFRELWDAAPRIQIDLAARFVEQYSGSIVLREAYEIAARAHVAEGHLAQGLTWAVRALRLMPENPALLVMVADTAAKERQHDLATT